MLITEKSFLPAFRVSFFTVATLRITPVLYGLWIAIGAIGALGMLTGMGVMPFGYISAVVFLLALIWAVVFFFLWVIGGWV